MPEATVRASSLGDLLDCAHRWEAKHILGMQGRTYGAAWLGSSIHFATAEYDSHFRDMTIADAVATFADHLLQPGKLGLADGVSWTDISPHEASAIGAGLVSRYCQDWSPRDATVSVEHTLQPRTVSVGTPYGAIDITFTGTMDRTRTVTSAPGLVRVRDVKTGKRAVVDGVAVTKGHAAQVALYQFLAKGDPGIEDMVHEVPEILGMSTAKRGEIALAEIHNAQEQLLGTAEQPGLIEYAALYLRTGLFPPNPRSMLCSESYCPRWGSCKYKE